MLKPKIKKDIHDFLPYIFHKSFNQLNKNISIKRKFVAKKEKF